MRDRATTTISALRDRLQRSLFLDAPQSPARFSRWEAALLVVALLTLGVILQILRIGPSASLNSLWAEDGQVFLQGAMNEGFWHAVFSPYAGYLVLVPRLIGEVADSVPLLDAPAAVAICSGLIVALCGLAIWFASAAQIRNSYLRATLVALTLLVPFASQEAVVSGAYVLWYMLFASFWILIWRPASMRGAMLGGLLVLATALTTPGVWFFAPLVALRALAIRDRRDATIIGAYALGAAIQVPVVLSNSAETVEPLWTSDIWTTLMQRLLDGGALGERVGGVAWEVFGWPFLIAISAAIVAGMAYGFVRANAVGRYFAAVAIPTALVMFVASVYQRAVGSQMMWPAGEHFGNGGRYVIVPGLLLLSVALVLIDRSAKPLRGPARLPWPAAAAVVVLMAGLVTSFYLRETAARGEPHWDNALHEGAAACVAEDLTEARIPTSPPGFAVVISCDRLASFSDADPAR